MNQQHFQRKAPANMIFGIHPIEEALDAGKTLDSLFVQRDTENPKIKAIVQELKSTTVSLKRVPLVKLNKFTRKNHQGIVAFFSPVAFQPLEEVVMKVFEEGRTPLLIMCDGITDVRNFGAIARSAEVLGADAIITATKDAAAVNEDTVKTSAGAVYHLPICRVGNLAAAAEYLTQTGIQLVAASEKADQLIFDADMTKPTCIVMGSEEMGVRPSILDMAAIGRIPQLGKVDSLNVSVAAGIFLAEAARQRKS